VTNILVLDIGSSSTRTLLYDARGQLIPGAVARQSLDFHVGPDGRSEDDPLQAFERIVAVLDELMARCAQDQYTIAAVGISAYASSLLCIDEHGAPLTPVYTYADTRFAQDARALRAEFDELAALQRTGCRIRSNYVPARIAWIKRTQPEVFRRARWFVSLSDYLCLRLFGVMRAGISVWSWSGLLNRRTLQWDAAWLDQLGITTDQLPSIAHDDEWAGPLVPSYAERWPMLQHALCLPALGDGAAAQASLPAALWGYRVDHGRELIGGATTEGGSVFQWLQRTLQLPEPAALEEAIARLPPDSHNLTILPLFSGERSPGYSEDSRATIHGLSLDSDPVQIARACLEAIAYRLCAIYNELQTVARPGALLIASGGALLASPAWCQIIADVTGASLTVCDEPEATSRGVAMLVLERLRWNRLSDLAESTRLGAVFEPDPGRHAVYRTAMARQQELYSKLI
jgi:gluconokinase